MRDIRLLFPTDDPVASNMLIGRAQDVEDIALALGNGQHLIIAGSRRIGKSTVGLAALERLANQATYTAAADLWDHDDLTGLVQALARSILANRGPVAKALRSARESGRDLFGLIPRGVTASLRTHLGEEVELAWSAPSAGPTEVTIAAVIQLAQRIADKDSRRIVLFLDEFQDIASGRFGDPDVLTKQLRAQLQRSPKVSVLFAGSIEHLMREMFGEQRRALSQFGSYYELSPILPSEWRAGLTARLDELEVVAEPQAVNEVVDRGEGHPRSTMLIARETVSVSLSRRLERTINFGDVVGGWELAMQADRLRHEEIVERLRSTAHAYSVAIRVARGERPYAGMAPAAARRALTMMEKAGIAERSRRGTWRIPEPLLRNYLASRP